MDRNVVIVVSVVVALVACLCAFAVAAAAAGLLVYRSTAGATTQLGPVFTQVFDADTPTPRPAAMLSPTPRPAATLTPLPTLAPGAEDTLQALLAETIPVNDLRELAMRLKSIPDIPVTVSDRPADHPVGAELTFFATDTDTNTDFQLTARLVYKTENVYFFVQDGVPFDQAAVQRLVDDFQTDIYPTNRAFFGSEPNPGVDGDPRLYMLYARGLGLAVGGYASSTDGYSRLAHAHSNEKEIFFLNADGGPADLNDPWWRSTLAHEFQHLIQDHQDQNEDYWMNEGASVLAEFLNGYSVDGVDYDFTAEPDLQLNTWTDDPDENRRPHYGAAFLFLTYFLDRFGSDATQLLVADETNGLRAVDDVLAAQGITDPVTGQPLTAVDVFADWVIANYLGDPSVADGRYDYHGYADAPTITFPTDAIYDCTISESATVHQYAADYYDLYCSGHVTITFTGSQQVSVVPTRPHSGRYALWSHRGDKSDMTLTRAFDLTGLTSATLRYSAWWQIEEDYDFAYLEVSTNGGKTWQIIQTPSSTMYNPTGNSFGWGHTANSGGGQTPDWIEETVDLSPYAGQQLLVRFEYITDDGVNLPGFMLDDISIPELDYAAHFEADDGGWEGEGFVRIDNMLPQRFIVQVIRRGEETTVERLPLDAYNRGRLALDLGRGETATLVVSGITPFTTELASYRFEIR